MTDTAQTQATTAEPAASVSPSDQAPVLSPEAIAATLKIRFHKVGFAGAHNLAGIIVLAFAKTFRINLTAQSDFPCALSLAPFETTPQHLPPKSIEAISPTIQALERLGFTQPLWHHLHHVNGSSDTVLVHMLHPSGQTVARITCHLLRIRKQPIMFVQFFSEVAGGQMLLTWPRGFELATPPDWVIHKLANASISETYAAHRKTLIEIAGARPLAIHSTPDSAREFMERRHHQLMQLQLDRGICVRLTPLEQQRLGKRAEYSKIAREISGEHADVLAEIARMQESTANWGSTIVILVFSLIAFVAAGLTRDKWDYKFLLILIGVLFVHEMGHYFAMKLSGYRNLRMFFIPFLGAAVSGQSYNVPGWKKTIVSLMGPVPGILLAIPLGITGLSTGNDTLTLIAIMSLILNGLNLAPVLPLDGGWVLHHLLFSRSVYLEIVFRVLAVGALILASVGFSDRMLFFIAIITAMQVPFAYKLATIVTKLRQANFVPVSHDDHTIPPEAAIPIIERVKEAFPRNLTTRNAATHTVAVFDRLNSRPPGWPVSILFLFIHGGALVVAFICFVVFMAGMHGGFRNLSLGRTNSALADLQASSQLKLQASLETIVPLSPPPAGVVPPIMLLADYKDHAAALDAARRVQPDAPRDAGVLVFGQTLLITLSSDDSATRDRLYTAISQGSTDPRVRRSNQPCSLMLQFDLPSEAAEHPGITELADFLSAPSRNRDYAPWDRADPRTPDSKARAAAMRKLRRQIIALPESAMDKKANATFSRKYSQAILKGDRTAQETLLAEQDAKVKEARLKHLATLAQNNPEHASLINAIRDGVNKTGDKAIYRDLDPLVEPLLELMPEGSPNPMGVSYGNAYIFGKSATIELSPLSPAHSLQAIINWLHERQLTNPRYQLFVYPAADPESLNEKD